MEVMSANNKQTSATAIDSSSVSSMKKMKKNALVIGAGPSGCVAAKYLLTSKQYEVTVLETSKDIGGTFVNKVYDNTRLVSSKYITAFSDYRMSDDEKNHPSAESYVQYLKDYCHKFGIHKCIRFGCTVISLQDNDDDDDRVKHEKEEEDVTLNRNINMSNPIDSNGYIVKYRQKVGKTLENEKEDEIIVTEHYDVVAVCSGLHNVPFIPSIPSISKFHGVVLHSSQYKDPSIFTDKRVLILGSGETAMDIAYRAIQNSNSKAVALNVRRGFLSIPHNLSEDQPLDIFITNVFEHSYEHPWVQKYRLRWLLSTIIIRFFLFLTGSSVGFNQWTCETSPIKRGYHIINKSHAAMSHLNVPIKRRWGLWGRLWLWIYGETNLRPIESYHKTSICGIQEDDGKTIQFDNGETYVADIIVLATGYKQSFPFLHDTIQADHRRFLSNETSNKKNDIESKYYLEEDALPSEHFIVNPNRPRLAFIGFVRPNVGAIPPMSELQVMWWLCRMEGKVNNTMFHNNKSQEEYLRKKSYMVLGKKYPYGVDYGNYMHRVAEDIHAAPTIGYLMTAAPTTTQSSSKQKKKHPPLMIMIKLLFTYCFGQSYISLFRLQGPYASKVCWDIVTNELYNVCIHRGIFENLGLLFVSFLSLWMNLMAWIIEIIWCLFTCQRPQIFVR